MDFPISVKIPGKAGDILTFKALQTYSNGEVVRWIGPPNADEPAPRVTVTSAKAKSASHSSGAVAVAGGGDDGGPSPLGLIAAAAAVALVGVVLLRRRMSHPMRGAQR
jgi:hypothetical protein